MRKKTSNKDLAKRAKKLLQTWQTVVNQHLKLNGVVVSCDSDATPTVNGVKGDTTHNNDTTTDVKLAVKRKRSSPDICSAKQALRPGLSPQPIRAGLSPRLVASPRPGGSPAPRQGLSPHMQQKRSGSPVVKSRLDPQNNDKLKRSGLMRDGMGGVCEPMAATLSDTTTLNKLNNNSSPLNNHEYNNNNSHKLSLNDVATIHHNNHNNNDRGSSKNSMSDGTPHPGTNSTDTRLQEDRIVLGDYISKNKCPKVKDTLDVPGTPEPPLSLSSEPRDPDPATSTGDIGVEPPGPPPIPEHFDPIEAEDLVVVRKELPEDIGCVGSEADGVNGVFDTNGEWRNWESNVMERNNELLLLPYVILD